MMLALYPSKKECKANIGKPLKYEETSVFGPEYKANGTFTVAYRPTLCNLGGREWFGQITMRDGLIAKVE